MYAEILDRKQPAIAARLQNRKSKSGGSFPISSKKKRLPSPKHSDSLCDSPKPLIECVRRFFPQVKSGRDVKVTAYSHLAKRSRMRGNISHRMSLCAQ